MQKMNFEFIVSFKNFYEDESNCYLTMEFIRGLELFEVKRDIGSKIIKKLYLENLLEYFTKSKLQFYIGSLVLILEYMHFINVVYRDLKPENIMVDSKVCELYVYM